MWWRRSWFSLNGTIGIQGQERGALLRHSAPQHQPTDPCTTLPRSGIPSRMTPRPEPWWEATHLALDPSIRASRTGHSRLYVLTGAPSPASRRIRQQHLSGRRPIRRAPVVLKVALEDVQQVALRRIVWSAQDLAVAVPAPPVLAARDRLVGP